MGVFTRRLMRVLVLASSDAAMLLGPTWRFTGAYILPARLKPVLLCATGRCQQPFCCVVPRASSSMVLQDRALRQRNKVHMPAESQATSVGGSRARAVVKHRVISLFAKAQKAARNGNLAASRALFQQCLALDKMDAHSWLALAKLEAGAGNESCARSLFKAACEACEPNVRLLQARGVFEARSGHAEAARAYFRHCTALQPRNAHVAHAWGLMEEGLGNVDAARRVFSDVLKVFLGRTGRLPAGETGILKATASQARLAERVRGTK